VAVTDEVIMPISQDPVVVYPLVSCIVGDLLARHRVRVRKRISN
jgi:hypothetical protein